MNVLLILNDPPYGTERTYNGMRHAIALNSRDDVKVRVFLMADATLSGKKGQKVPNGYYHLERMLGAAVRRGTEIGACGTCLDARGLAESEMIEGVHRSSMEELTEWTLWADKVIVY